MPPGRPRHGGDDFAADLRHAVDVVDQSLEVRYVFQHLGADDRVEMIVGKRNVFAVERHDVGVHVVELRRVDDVDADVVRCRGVEEESIGALPAADVEDLAPVARKAATQIAVHRQNLQVEQHAAVEFQPAGKAGRGVGDRTKRFRLHGA